MFSLLPSVFIHKSSKCQVNIQLYSSVTFYVKSIQTKKSFNFSREVKKTKKKKWENKWKSTFSFVYAADKKINFPEKLMFK